MIHMRSRPSASWAYAQGPVATLTDGTERNATIRYGAAAIVSRCCGHRFKRAPLPFVGIEGRRQLPRRLCFTDIGGLQESGL
jgi:hypothetical protein